MDFIKELQHFFSSLGFRRIQVEGGLLWMKEAEGRLRLIEVIPGASAGTDPCAGQPAGGENSPSGESADDPIRREDGQADVDAVSWSA